MLTRSTLLSSTTSTSRRRLYCSLLLAGDRTDPEILAGLAFRALRGDAYALSGPRYPAMEPTAPGIPDAVYRGRRPRRAGTESPLSASRSCGWNPWRWGGFAKANSAVSPQRSRRAGSLARSGTRRIRECGPARATATAVPRIDAISKQFATNSRNPLLFVRSAARFCGGGGEKIELVIVWIRARESAQGVIGRRVADGRDPIPAGVLIEIDGAVGGRVPRTLVDSPSCQACKRAPGSEVAGDRRGGSLRRWPRIRAYEGF
jgi:hypothetical protein